MMTGQALLAANPCSVLEVVQFHVLLNISVNALYSYYYIYFHYAKVKLESKYKWISSS